MPDRTNVLPLWLDQGSYPHIPAIEGAKPLANFQHPPSQGVGDRQTEQAVVYRGDMSEPWGGQGELDASPDW